MNPQAAYDALLEWCSEIGRGTFEQFREACRYLHLEVSEAVRALDQLAHVEFNRSADTFAAADTALISIPGLPGRMVVTGARPRTLHRELVDLSHRSGLDVEVPTELPHQFGKGPSTLLIELDPGDAPAFCDLAEIAYGADAHRNIADILPSLSIDHATVKHRPDARFPHTLVDPHTFKPRWDDDVSDDRPGLWLYRSWGWSRKYVLRGETGEPRLVIDDEVAFFLMDRPEPADPIIEYQEAHRLLRVNASTPLPRLQARASCLCSGRSPIRHYLAPGVAVDHFVNVDPATAASVFGSLGLAR